jgi:predicted HTH domain antitoxin
MMEAWKTKDFVSAGLYEDENAVVQDAVRALLSERPHLRLEVAIHRYRAEEISLARAAALAGVSWERMREILLSQGVRPRLGPETDEEADEEIRAMERILHEDSRRILWTGRGQSHGLRRSRGYYRRHSIHKPST